MKGALFGRLRVIDRFGTDKSTRLILWRCQCVCGKYVVTRSHALRSGHTVSCGCAKKKHGLGTSKTYYSWVEMKRRCLNKTRWEYLRYGARGITVCKRWLKFANFLEDMGIKPDGTTLDRLDGTRGYYKENCRWATAREQIINRSITRWITFRGETRCLSDWAVATGLPAHRIAQRIDNWGWSIKDALTQPIQPYVKLKDRL